MFKVEARNSYGYSVASETIQLLCAFKPEPPTSVTTSNSNELVTVTWTSPVTNGSPITRFRVFIQEKNSGVYTEEAVNCLSTSAAVIANNQCTISLETLKAAPYSLVKGDSVNAKVVSVNVYGESA